MEASSQGADEELVRGLTGVLAGATAACDARA